MGFNAPCPLYVRRAKVSSAGLTDACMAFPITLTFFRTRAERIEEEDFI